MTSTSVRIEAVSKRFGEVTAVDRVDLSVAKGEFFTLLGSSGCGKTTLLRIVAGFMPQSDGRILFGDACIDAVPAHRRNTGMVFQNYAIFPHLTVVENIAYGLRARGLAAGEINERVGRMLAMMRLEHLGHRRPRELSGGQQQRVVLARAIVIEPDVLLMDEPLSNLDTEMRVHLRGEIRALQRQIGITTLYVTHDQEEALMMSDRVAVMSGGRVEQVGTPAEIFHRPRTRFVAAFIGETNFLPATRLGAGGNDTALYDVPGGGRLAVPSGQASAAGSPAEVAFRSHDLIVGPATESGWTATVTDTQFYGATVRLVLELAPNVFAQAALTGAAAQTLPPPGSRVGLSLHSQSPWIFPAKPQ